MRKIILVGPGCSGKDTAKKTLVEKGYKPSISYTSRPSREVEVNGKDYFFISKEQFQDKIANGDFLEYAMYKEWYYGTPKSEIESKEVFILTPDGIAQLSKEQRQQATVIYINPHPGALLRRLIERNDKNDTVYRRFTADQEMFANFTDYDLETSHFESSDHINIHKNNDLAFQLVYDEFGNVIEVCTLNTNKICSVIDCDFGKLYFHFFDENGEKHILQKDEVIFIKGRHK